MKSPAKDELLPVGTVVGTHGLRGDLKVRPHSGSTEVLVQAAEVFLEIGGGPLRRYQVARAVSHKGNALLRLAGQEDVNSAQSLVGGEVLLPASALPRLDEDEFYWHQLQGLAVHDRQRGDLGTLEDLFSTPAHDIYVVRGRFGEILIPAVDQFVVAIEVEDGRMTVDLPEGFVPSADDL